MPWCLYLCHINIIIVVPPGVGTLGQLAITGVSGLLKRKARKPMFM